MIIHRPEIVYLENEVRLQTRVETRAPNSGLPETLWFSYPRQYAGELSTRGDSPLAALILVAMTLGEDITCHAEVSPRLLYQLAEYQRTFHHWRPHLLHMVEVHADIVTPSPAPSPQAGYAATFSGGVDSLFTIQQTVTPSSKNPQWPLKYGLFLQGSADIPLAYTHKFEQLTQRYARVAQEINLELIPVRTNLMEFAARRIAINTFQEAPLIGAALGLSPILTGLLIPAGKLYERYQYSAASAITVHILGTEAFESISHGAAFIRFEKTRSISNWRLAQENLRVCLGWNHESDYNCSHCSKCLRTRMDLHVLGKLAEFSTLKSPYTFKDVLLWGRWMEIGYGWEKDLFNYAWKQRKAMLPAILLGIQIGYPRYWLRKYLPNWIKQPIFRLTAEKDPHGVFAKSSEKTEGSNQ